MLKFERYQDRYGPGGWEVLLGRWVVGKTAWGIGQRRGEPPYVASCYLPGIKDRFGPFATEEEAKGKIEWAVSQWIALAGLQQLQRPDEEPGTGDTASPTAETGA